MPGAVLGWCSCWHLCVLLAKSSADPAALPLPRPLFWAHLLPLTQSQLSNWHLILGFFCHSRHQELKGLQVASLILRRTFGKGSRPGLAEAAGEFSQCVWCLLVDSIQTAGGTPPFLLPALQPHPIAFHPMWRKKMAFQA